MPLKYEFQIDQNTSFLTVREAIAIVSETKEKLWINIQHNKQGFTATTPQIKDFKVEGKDIKDLFTKFSQAYYQFRNTN